MHFCIMMFTKEKPTPKYIDDILEPYYEHTVYLKKEVGDFPIIMWDYFEIGGRFSDVLNDNMYLHAVDIKNYDELEVFGCIDVDGKAYAKEHWTGNEWKEHPEYWDKLQEIKTRNKDCYVTILDLHD